MYSGVPIVIPGLVSRRRRSPLVSFSFSRSAVLAALGDAEVEHLDEVLLTVAGQDEDVLRLDVAVDDVHLVRRLDGARDLRADVQRARDVQLPLAVDELAELDPLEVLHHEEERAVGGGPGVGDVDDVGVRDLRGGARLAPQPLDEIGRLAVGRVQDLERHAPADVDVLGLEHPPHPPSPMRRRT